MKRLHRLSLGLILPLLLSFPLQAYELAEILGAPYSSGLVSARDKEQIAWITYEKGIRNIWTARAPEFEPVRLTAYARDDGQQRPEVLHPVA